MRTLLIMKSKLKFYLLVNINYDYELRRKTQRRNKTPPVSSPLIFIFVRINRSVSGAEARRGVKRLDVGRWTGTKGPWEPPLLGAALGASHQISIAKISSYAS